MLRVLTYHRLAEAAQHPDLHPGLISATPAQFEAQIRYASHHYDLVSLADVLAAESGGPALPRRAVLLTFDDAYEDFAGIAWPILKRYGAPVTLFVPTGYPDQPQRQFWWDRLYRSVNRSAERSFSFGGQRFSLVSDTDRAAALRQLQTLVKQLPHAVAMEGVDEICSLLGASACPTNHVLGWSELRRLSAEGVTLAAHSRTHPLLTQMSLEEVYAEASGAQRDLETHFGTAPPALCYPAGAHDADVLHLLRRMGFRLGFTTLDGHNPDLNEPLRLRRTNITPRTSLPVFQLRLSRLGGRIDQWRHRTQNAALARRSGVGPRIAYIMSRFPRLTETFVFGEILEQDRLGRPVEIFPLLRERQAVAHPEVAALVGRAHFSPFLSGSILRDNAYYLWHSPGKYLRALAEVLGGTLGSANFFFGALGIFPKSVWFARRMQELGIGHVHAHFATHPAVAALIVHRLTDIPFSFTAHGSDLHVEKRMLAHKVAAARFAVTISDFNRDVMIQHGGLASKIHVVHCGVDTDRFRPPTEPRLPGPLRILSVGSLEEVKGHAFLIRACGRLAEQGLDFTCEIIGEGGQRDALERLIRDCNLSNRVRLRGPLPRNEVLRALQSADVMALASIPTPGGKREGIPVSLMEAMACGLPVVSSRLSGIPELITDGVEGFLCMPRDVAAIAQALHRLRDSDLRTRMGTRGRTRILRDFQLAANARALRALMLGSEPATLGASAPESVTELVS